MSREDFEEQDIEYILKNDDCIRREAVLKLVKDWSCNLPYIETETKGAIEDVNAVPAANVRFVVEGEWIEYRGMNEYGEYEYGYKCSVCKKKGFSVWKFCPYCGADMIGRCKNGTQK